MSTATKSHPPLNPLPSREEKSYHLPPAYKTINMEGEKPPLPQGERIGGEGGF